MALLAPLSNMLCRHEFYWSERHHSDRCRRCGLMREGERPGGEMYPPATVGDVEVACSQAGLVDWRRPRMAGMLDETPAHAGPSASDLHRQTEERRRALPELLQAIANGGELSRSNILDMAMALIEDGHSSDPQVFGPRAAEHFATLNAARHDT